MRFTDAHSSSGVLHTEPLRAAHRTVSLAEISEHRDRVRPPVLDAAELTPPEMLKAKGYRTACIGKWHLGWNWSDIQKPGVQPEMDAKGRNKIFPPNVFDWTKPISGGPLSHGFDYYFGDDVPNFPPYAWFENDRVITEPAEPLNIAPKTAEGSSEARPGPMAPGRDFYAVVPKLAAKAGEWIGRQRGHDGPFFLYVPFNSPHARIVPATEYTGKSQAGGYGAFMVRTDDKAGRILRAQIRTRGQMR